MKPNSLINIVKYNGDVVPFEINKLIDSLRRSNAKEGVIQSIAYEIKDQIKEGMTTKKIYQMAFRLLKKKSRVSASKYKLKKALMELGPSGYPFENFVGKVLKHEGFDVEVGVVEQGNCVQHEMDVIAQKEDKYYMIECKYHSSQGRFCNVRVPLYIHSRFLDMENKWKHKKGHKNKIHKGGLYTNTRFTSDAIQYGRCVGLLMTSWDYPMNNGLKDRIDKLGLHPLTALTNLTKAEKTKLLDTGIVLCRELHENPSLLTQIGVHKRRHKKILEDSEELCKSNRL